MNTTFFDPTQAKNTKDDIKKLDEKFNEKNIGDFEDDIFQQHYDDDVPQTEILKQMGIHIAGVNHNLHSKKPSTPSQDSKQKDEIPTPNLKLQSLLRTEEKDEETKATPLRRITNIAKK